MRRCYTKLKKTLLFWRRSNDGAAAVEFALVAVPFLALLLGSIQIFVVYLAQEVLETAADASSRQILTGSAQSAAMTQSQFVASVCGNLPALLQCGVVMTDVQVASSFSTANVSTPTLTYNQQGQVTNQWQYNLGTQGQIVVMRLMYQWPAFNFILNLSTQSNGTRLLMATRVFRNENY